MLDEETLRSLPSHDDFARLYGEKPVIVGLETCANYRSLVAPEDRIVAPAGAFNSGTNLLASLLSKNCVVADERERNGGVRWQVPWGKHAPASSRQRNVAAGGGAEGVVQKHVLPVVAIKDPYTWMASMCRHPYSANWYQHPDHCPNLVTNHVDLERFRDVYENEKLRYPGAPPAGRPKDAPVRVVVRNSARNTTVHASLAGLWSDWYGEYRAVRDWPRLMVRYEDLLLYPREVVRAACECAGGTLSRGPRFVLVAESAKGSDGAHRGAEGLLAAVRKYGDAETREKEFTRADLDYARSHLDSDLMEAFGYHYII